jgi:hypothetical protein
LKAPSIYTQIENATKGDRTANNYLQNLTTDEEKQRVLAIYIQQKEEGNWEKAPQTFYTDLESLDASRAAPRAASSARSNSTDQYINVDSIFDTALNALTFTVGTKLKIKKPIPRHWRTIVNSTKSQLQALLNRAELENNQPVVSNIDLKIGTINKIKDQIKKIINKRGTVRQLPIIDEEDEDNEENKETRLRSGSGSIPNAATAARAYTQRSTSANSGYLQLGVKGGSRTRKHKRKHRHSK